MSSRPSRSSRHIYLSTVLDTDIFNIILKNCNLSFIDKREIELEINQETEDQTIREFLLNKQIEHTVYTLIKGKKNRHIIYFLRKSDPVEIKKSLEQIIRNHIPSSKFYYTLITTDEDWLNHEDFYAVYVLKDLQ